MSALYIVLIIIGISAQSVLKKWYSKKTSGGVFVFSAVSVLTACLFFVIKSGFKFNFHPEILPYDIGFAAAFCSATLFGFLAILTGPLSLTSLATSYSLLSPTFWGILFDGDKTSVWLYIGLVLLAASLVFINLKDKPNSAETEGTEGEVKMTLKWAIFVLIALVTNGACSTIQPAQTRIFGGKYDSIFIIIAVFVFVKERREIVPSLKSGGLLMVICGATNGLVNLLVMLASPLVNNSVFFPLISAGGIVLTWIISVTLYKEKLSIKQNIGLVLGIASIVFLNL